MFTLAERGTIYCSKALFNVIGFCRHVQGAKSWKFISLSLW